MGKKFFIPILFLLATALGFSQTTGRDAFLGTWVTKDSKNEIKVIKEGNLFYIVEFVRIRHELFFSGDGKRAFFQEWGKGPPGNIGEIFSRVETGSCQHR